MIITQKAQSLQGMITVPGDKSISHRAALLLAISEGEAVIGGFLPAQDCLDTLSCLRQLGIEITQRQDQVHIVGKGLKGFRKPDQRLYAGNSGTTLRLLCGLLAGQDFESEVGGDASLQRRPMGRVIDPLRKMGACIWGKEDEKAPVCIQPSLLRGITYTPPMASAQVKSAVLLAGLYAKGLTAVREPLKTRDHTERMLLHLGAALDCQEDALYLRAGSLSARDIAVPGDLSSAAFLLCAAAALPGSDLTVQGVGLNPTRTGFLEVLEEMGATLSYSRLREEAGERRGDVRVKGARLRGVNLGASRIPRLIDEIPALCVIASIATGPTTISGAQELKVKEADRIQAMACELTRLGAAVSERPDGLSIEGGAKLQGGLAQSYGDHRVAMALAIAGLFSKHPVRVPDSACVDISYPGFAEALKSVCK